jgi:hypothetical protein
VTRYLRRNTAAALALLVVASCGGTCAAPTEQGVRSALDAFALAGGAAWTGLNEACIYRQQAINAEAHAGRITTADARAQLVPIRARCHELTALFVDMRAAQDQAAALVEAGKIDEAREWLERLRAYWTEANELGGSDAGVDASAVADASEPVVIQLDGGAP